MNRIALALSVATVVCAGPSYLAAQASPPPPGLSAQTKQAPPAAKSASGESAETIVQVKDLPAAVRATVEAETKNATLKGLSKEREKGQTVYELESLVNGRTRDLMIDSSGKVYEIEEQLDVADAPAPVKAALEAKGTIIRLESVREGGRTTYEGKVKTKAGKKIEMELDADGKPIGKK